MKRNLSTHIYVVAFVISILIFVIGVYVGSVIDSTNLNTISNEVSNVSGRVASLQLLLLSEGNSTSFCPVYISELQNLDNEIENIGYRLSFLEDEKQIFDNELKRKYFVLETESYLLSKKLKVLCKDESILLIHFYSNKNCGTTCTEQGAAILQARDQLVSEGYGVKLFSFDGELDSLVAEALETEYNVTMYPTIVINEKTYLGFQSVEQIKNISKAEK
ncbi:MAG: hypothetical protein ABH842_03595 [Candidatus Micrarchaeota archaeon]